MALYNHQNNFGTNVTSNQVAGVTTTPLNSIPSVSAPFKIALDATNTNGHYEVATVTSKTATNINHAATTYAHSTDEEVRLVVDASEMDALWDNDSTGWVAMPLGVTLAYSSADDPTYVVTTSSDLSTFLQKGDRIKFTNNSTTFYGIITAITSGTITLYGGTDYDVANSAITAVYFSHQKSPFGFPMDPTKWTVVVTDATERTGAISATTWTNVGSTNHQISIPIGVWDVSYQASVTTDRTSAGTGAQTSVTLSTANNTASDVDFNSLTGYYSSGVANAGDAIGGFAQRSKVLVLAAKTLYYLNIWSFAAGSATVGHTGSSILGGATVIKARSAYL